MILGFLTVCIGVILMLSEADIINGVGGGDVDIPCTLLDSCEKVHLNGIEEAFIAGGLQAE